MTAPEDITPGLILRAYRAGVFPMAEDADADTLFWVDPPQRGIIPVDGFHISKSLKKRIRSGRYSASVNQCFIQVMRRCASRQVTWINADILRLYTDLHEMGHGHSVEIWEGEQLIGGVYGLAIGAAFFGESMFSDATDGSKMALAALVALLQRGGYRLFDVQFLTPHLQSLGAIEIPRAAYHQRLKYTVNSPADASVFQPQPAYSLTQLITQIS